MDIACTVDLLLALLGVPTECVIGVVITWIKVLEIQSVMDGSVRVAERFQPRGCRVATANQSSNTEEE